MLSPLTWFSSLLWLPKILSALKTQSFDAVCSGNTPNRTHICEPVSGQAILIQIPEATNLLGYVE
jgi:hypothetical protein